MDLAQLQAAHLFQQGRVPEQALRWAPPWLVLVASALLLAWSALVFAGVDVVGWFD